MMVADARRNARLGVETISRTDLIVRSSNEAPIKFINRYSQNYMPWSMPSIPNGAASSIADQNCALAC